MNRNIAIFFLGLALWSQFSSASDSGIFGPPYSSIQIEMSELALSFSDWAEKIDYGVSPNGNVLSMIRIAKKRSNSSEIRANRAKLSKAVYISGATHGNEYLNIEDRLARYFLENRSNLPHFDRFLQNDGVLYVVPIVNPDGYEARTRRNANGVDINRDFPVKKINHSGLTQPESSQLVSFLFQDLKESMAHLVFTLDYHCCKGALIHPWSFNSEPLPDPDFGNYQEVGDKMKSIFGSHYWVGNTEQVLTQPRTGTSKDFFYENFQSLSFTFEGKKYKENENFQKHVEFWENIFEWVVKID
jgi:hypothetical protein